MNLMEHLKTIDERLQKGNQQTVPEWKKVEIRERTKRGDANIQIRRDLKTSYETIKKYRYVPK